ncbi:MAG: hypothetical protein WC873_03925 [Candidatus Gracilibacteria bacterium]
MKKLLQRAVADTRGYALILVAVGISILLLYFAVIVFTNTQTTQRNIKAFKASSDAKNIAEGVMGMLIGIGVEHEAGFSLSEEECKALISTSRYVQDATANGVKITCNIKGRPVGKDKIGDWYTTPAINTGNASTNCQPLRPINDIDHPCNWGRLNFGTSISSRVVIPLYYEENNEVKNPSDFDFSDLRIKVRTPCKPVNGKFQETCDDGGRRKFGVSPFEPIDVNRTIAMWQISATCVGTDGREQSCGLTPDTSYNSNTKRREFPNSEIHELFIDDNGYIDLNDFGKSFGFGEQSVTISDFFTSPNVKEPTLQLAIIARNMKDEDDQSIPNLEYQIVYDSDTPISNNAQIYTVEVDYNGQLWKEVDSIEPEKNVVDFAIQN